MTVQILDYGPLLTSGRSAGLLPTSAGRKEAMSVQCLYNVLSIYVTSDNPCLTTVL